MKSVSLLVVTTTATGFVEEVVHVCTKSVQGVAQKTTTLSKTVM